MTQSRQPIFNVPAIVVAVLAVLLAVHLVRLFVLPPKTELEFLLLFAFIPARYDASLLIGGAMPGGLAADIWTFVTYSLIHADFMHLGFNSIWLLAFGTPVARRFGAWRFLAFFAVTAAAGAAAHLSTHAARIAADGRRVGVDFRMHGGRDAVCVSARRPDLEPRRRSGRLSPAGVAADAKSLRDRRVLIFLVVWFGLNFLFGFGSLSITGSEQSDRLAGAYRRICRRAAAVRIVRSGVSATRRRRVASAET